MTSKNVQKQWEDLWNVLDQEAREIKFSEEAIIKLSEVFKELSLAERGEVSKLLALWVISDDEVKRYDALALIDEFNIEMALPQLLQLERKMNKSNDHSVMFELRKIKRIINKLKRKSS